jgi:hypothetical protein
VEASNGQNVSFNLLELDSNSLTSSETTNSNFSNEFDFNQTFPDANNAIYFEQSLTPQE